MANARVYFKVRAGDIRKAVKERGAKKIIALTKNPYVLKQIADEAIKIITPYVPKDSGALQKSAHVIYHEKQVQIVWGDRNVNTRETATEKYAHYQYEGVVYGPNIPMRINGAMEWRSPKNKKKYRKSPTQYLVYKSTNAKRHWTDVLKRGTKEFDMLVDYAEPLVKEEIRNES